MIEKIKLKLKSVKKLTRNLIATLVFKIRPKYREYESFVSSRDTRLEIT